jgi:hypothetical protein
MSQKQPTVQKPAVSSGDNNKNTASGSNTSGSSSGSSGNKNNNNTGNNSVTKTVTVTTGGRGGQIENVGPYLPEVTTTTSVTLENAVENWDGTITQTDPEGRKATYSSEGELINIKDAQGNLTYGKEPTYWDNYNNNMNWGQNL